ncbi:hypothetical protein BGW38_000085 [Lunasporangiospora selenospora]|uniref:Cardiolipin synthase N-terminal domain-containing protein n=1 Tax=Lunasporangiospora selenospora TaxID=979761 RepID=A0A9P6FVD0_9FUNG|nr:hypothetical protein BGW38_000085 [Lunasporangiospora selenospora]
MAPIIEAATSTVASMGSYAIYSGSLVCLIILILDLIAVVRVLDSDRSVLSKFLWCLLIFLCPIVGILIYLLFANRERHHPRYVSIP